MSVSTRGAFLAALWCIAAAMVVLAVDGDTWLAFGLNATGWSFLLAWCWLYRRDEDAERMEAGV